MISEKLMSSVLGILVAIMAIAASAQLSISLPENVSVAPITGQSLAILVAAHILKWKNATVTVVLYLLIGAFGIPVFSDFSSGTEVLFGNSAGYLLGFVVSSAVVGIMADKNSKRFTNYLLQMTVGTILILLCGGLGLLRFLDVHEVFSLGIKPFLFGAIAKIFLGAILLSVYWNIKKKLTEF